MHNPWEEFIKKTVFLMALGFWVSTTDTFQRTVRLFEEDHKVIMETRADYDKMGSSVKSDLPLKVEVKTNSR
jgi:hypothetical protein